MPDTRGDVLCPTCGQWTPPAPFCTECGATLQVDFQESAGDAGGPFRRGQEVDQPGSPWGGGERFEPEPEDQAARAAAAGAAAAGIGPRVDHLAEVEETATPPWPSADAAPPDAAPSTEPEAPVEPPPAAPRRRTRAKTAEAAAAAAVVAGAAATEPVVADAAPDAGPPAEPTPPTEVVPPQVAAPPPPPPAPPPVTYAGPPRDDDGGSGVTGLVFVVFLGIGVLALLGGALLGGLFDGPTAEASPTPSEAVATASPTPTPVPSASPSAVPSAPTGTATPAPTPPPATDGFIARAEPCDEQPTDSTCDESGAENNGTVWILVSFRHALPSDVIAVEILDESGTLVDDSSIPLSFCGTSTDCAGYTYFQFSNLDDGDYDVRAKRNGTEVATTAFTVD